MHAHPPPHARARRPLGALQDSDALRASDALRDATPGNPLLLSTIAVVAVAITVLSGGSAPELAPGKPVPGAPGTLALLKGIPQQGIDLGNPQAPVTLVEFGDLQCPQCAQFAQHALPTLLSRYVRSGRVRLQFRSLDSIGNDSLRAARMASAMGEQNHLWEFVDLMYDHQAAENSGYVTDRYLRALAGAIPGAHVNRALIQRASPTVNAQIARAQQLAAQYHVQGTPTFVLEHADGSAQVLSPASTSAASSFTGPLDRALAADGPAADGQAQAASEEERAIDSVLAYTPAVVQGANKGDEVALTFDDGPGPYTVQLVETLNRLHVQATFFAIGEMERYFSQGTLLELGSGDVVGDHTQTHPPLATLSPHDQYEQLINQIYQIQLLNGPTPRLFRPPYGSFNASTFRELHHLHLLMILWSTDTSDYARPGVQAIVHSALAGAHPGAIILMHDGGGDRSQTIAALPAIVHGLLARGLHPVTVPRLLLDDPPPPGQPIPTNLSGG
jgi:peptidoglycan/xylan/chitin deacetylase (PgdA/CDA1 family)/protein-disulfide isomerase